MKIRSATKAWLITLAAMAQLSSSGDAAIATAASSESSLCVRCLTRDGCKENCDCRCTDPNLSMGSARCQEDGTVSGDCTDWSTTPPRYTGTVCDTHDCPPDPPPCGPPSEYTSASGCEACGYYWNYEAGFCESQPTPILINLKSNSSNYDLTSASDGVEFDIYANGIPTRIGWTSADSEIAFLVLDRNGNGLVDDASELFGNYTRKRDGTIAANGFEALLDLDGGPGVSDNRIAPTDAIYLKLRLWLDANHNGFSEPNELIALSDGSVAAVFTSYRETPRVDRNGNEYRYEGSALVLKNGREHVRKVFDVVFATQ